MKNMKNFESGKAILQILVLMVLSGVVSAATVGPIVTVSGYTISPTTVKPGVSGFASVTLTNTGDTLATALLVLYGKLDSSVWSGSSKDIGDLASGTDTTIVIPFQVPETYPAGVYSLPLQVSYSGSHSANFVIPISVSKPPVIQVITQNISKQAVNQGEEFEVSLLINNFGGDAKDFVITSPENSSFQLNGISNYQLPILQADSSNTVLLKMISSSSIATGNYNVPLSLTYTDLLGNTVSDTINLGLINLVDLSTLIGVAVDEIGVAEVGSVIDLNITLFNHGYADETGIYVEPESSSYLVTIGSPSAYFDIVPANGQTSQIILIGINPSTDPGYYSIPLQIKTSDGQSFNTSVGIQIQAASAVIITADTNPSALVPGSTADLTLKISNTGDTGIRSTSISLSSDEIAITGQSESFLGTLNIDDTTSLVTSIRIPANISFGTKTITASLSFKNSNNLVHKIDKVITIDVLRPDQAAGLNASQSTIRQRTETGIFAGLGILPYAVGAVIGVIAIYFVYRWWAGKKKK